MNKYVVLFIACLASSLTGMEALDDAMDIEDTASLQEDSGLKISAWNKERNSIPSCNVIPLQQNHNLIKINIRACIHGKWYPYIDSFHYRQLYNEVLASLEKKLMKKRIKNLNRAWGCSSHEKNGNNLD